MMRYVEVNPNADGQTNPLAIKEDETRKGRAKSASAKDQEKQHVNTLTHSGPLSVKAMWTPKLLLQIETGGGRRSKDKQSPTTSSRVSNIKRRFIISPTLENAGEGLGICRCTASNLVEAYAAGVEDEREKS